MSTPSPRRQTIAYLVRVLFLGTLLGVALFATYIGVAMLGL